MSRQRQKIYNKIKSNLDKIHVLQQENAEYEKAAMLLCDKKQWFVEKEEEVVVRVGRLRKKEKYLIGRIHWKEFFQDEDKPKGEGVWVERSQVVRVNGEWEF